MARSKKNEKVKVKEKTRKVKKGGFFASFKGKLLDAEDSAKAVAILLLLTAILTVIIGGLFFYRTHFDITIAKEKLHDEFHAQFRLEENSEQRQQQVETADEAKEVYVNIMNRYTNDTNVLVSEFAKISNDNIRRLIIQLLVLPAELLILMLPRLIFIDKNIFYVIIDIPIVLIKFLKGEYFSSKKKEIPSSEETEEAAN